jgi:hypothetical protein
VEKRIVEEKRVACRCAWQLLKAVQWLLREAQLIITVLILWVVWFPFIASLVAPDGRRGEFFLLTLFVVVGPLGVACAAIANPRP